MSIEFITIILSLIAIGIAIWQGYLSKQQLEESKKTKSDTEKLLDEIRSKVYRIEVLTDENRKDVKEQIAKLIDKQDENFKLLLNAPKEDSQNEMIKTFLPMFLEKPEIMQTLIAFGQNRQ